MKIHIKIWLLLFLSIGFSANAMAAKKVVIRLTGTSYEKILMTVGETGRTEIISSLPYEFELPKELLPIRLTFQSENYLYYSIDIPKKPFDAAGHVYLLKINEMAMSLQNNNNNNNANSSKGMMNSSYAENPIQGIDTTDGVNAAPITGHKSPHTFALIIANEEYELASKVSHAQNDGLAFKEYCLKTIGLPNENIKFVTNVSYGKMKKALNDMEDLISLYDKEKTNLIVYYAGHGIPDNQTKDAYLMPIDADGTDTEICFSLQSFYDKLNSFGLNQCVVFLDACFSGAQRDGNMVVAARGVKLKPKESKPQGNTVVFSATSGEDAAYAYDEEEHGMFTYFLLKKLQDSKGKVKLGELSEYLTEMVSKESLTKNNNRQTPTVSYPSTLSDKWQSMKLQD